jgi:Galactose oxidase, central domain
MKSLVLSLLLCAAASAQTWTKVGGFPVGVPASTTHDPNARPYWIAFTSAHYDDVNQGLLISFASPTIEGYSNATFLYQVATNSWTNIYSHTTNGHATNSLITALSRNGNVVSATIATPEEWPVDASVHRYLGISACKGQTMQDPSFATAPIQATQLDALHFTYPQVGPDKTLSCTNCGCAWGMLDADDAPADGQVFHQKAWDTTRHILWKAFGVSNAILSTGTTYVANGAAKSTYKFDSSSGVWAEVCGDLTSPCNVPNHEQSAMTYFPDTDRVVLEGGFTTGTKVANTWELNPSTGTWTQICTTSTCGNGSLVSAHGLNLVYFPDIHKAVLVGGQILRNSGPLCQNNSTQFCNTQTWLYDSANTAAPNYGWTQAITAHAIPGLWFPIIDYDADKNAVVMVDYNQSGSHVWTFDGTDWTDITAKGLIPPGPIMSSQGSQNFGAYDRNAHVFVTMFKNDSTGKPEIWKVSLP